MQAFKALKRERDVPELVNQAVNFKLECIFIAVPKTGSTSVRSQVREKGRSLFPGPHLNIMQVRDLLYAHCLNRAFGKNLAYPTGDVPDDGAVRAQAREIFESFFKFAGVRNPWARAVSLYHRREGVQAEEHMSFTEFCQRHRYASDTCRFPTRHRNQLDWLCDESGECVMDYVFKVEEFEKAIDEVAERTNGRIQLEPVKKNVNPGSRSRRYRSLYTDETKKLIAKRFEKDIDYFGYTF